MTATAAEQTMQEALAMIDAGLSHTQSRELIAASEVADLLLDLRLLLMQVEAANPEPAPAALTS